MSRDRLEQLRAMLAEEPGDLFLRYAIALEHKRMGAMEQAVLQLEDILREEPGHLPSYYQLAVMLADLGRSQEAIEACNAGSLRCIVAGDRKARLELLALKDQISGDLS
jgi:tetratricopeptide (TPR) repeat protein